MKQKYLRKLSTLQWQQVPTYRFLVTNFDRKVYSTGNWTMRIRNEGADDVKSCATIAIPQLYFCHRKSATHFAEGSPRKEGP